MEQRHHQFLTPQNVSGIKAWPVVAYIIARIQKEFQNAKFRFSLTAANYYGDDPWAISYSQPPYTPEKIILKLGFCVPSACIEALKPSLYAMTNACGSRGQDLNVLQATYGQSKTISNIVWKHIYPTDAAVRMADVGKMSVLDLLAIPRKKATLEAKEEMFTVEDEKDLPMALIDRGWNPLLVSVRESKEGDDESSTIDSVRIGKDTYVWNGIHEVHLELIVSSLAQNEDLLMKVLAESIPAEFEP